MEPTRYVGTRASSSEQGCGVLSDASERESGILEGSARLRPGGSWRRRCYSSINILFWIRREISNTQSGTAQAYR